MGWGDHYRRRAAIDSVLARPTGLDGPVPDGFADREELALALQYRWSQQLTGRIAVALTDAGHAHDVDHVEAVATAWRTTAAHHRRLRALLDDYAAGAGPVFRRTQRAEQRMVALAAGLADAGETPEEAARIGAAFLALVRGTPKRQARSGTLVDQLIRRLVASS